MANIFLNRESTLQTFIDIFYNLLIQRSPISYIDIIYEADPNINKDYFKNHTINSYEHHSTLKKAVRKVNEELESRYPGCIKTNDKRKGKTYQYIGTEDDPLRDDRKHSRQQTIEDYVKFCKGTIGLLPKGWFPSFFEGTNLLLEAKREIESDCIPIETSRDTQLKNIELLPSLYNAIVQRRVISFEYSPFDKAAYKVTLHPQYLKESNKRWFLLGLDANNEELKIIPIDRISSSPEQQTTIDYIPAPKGFYREYFQNIVGIRHAKDGRAKEIHIRTYTPYFHGLVKTKPFHHSQTELKPFGKHEEGKYGEFSIYVEPTDELMGKIVSLGGKIELISPPEVRKQAQDYVAELSSRYNVKM